MDRELDNCTFTDEAGNEFHFTMHKKNPSWIRGVRRRSKKNKGRTPSIRNVDRSCDTCKHASGIRKTQRCLRCREGVYRPLWEWNEEN